VFLRVTTAAGARRWAASAPQCGNISAMINGVRTANGTSAPKSSRRRALRGPLVPSARIAALGLAACLALGMGMSAGVGTAAASGNGLNAKSATAMVATALAAGRSATSVTIAGSLPDDGGTITLNITDNSMGDGKGSVAQGGNTIQIIQIGPVNYFRAGTAFWKKVGGGSAGAQLFAGKWLKSSGSNSPGASFSQLTKFKTLLPNGTSGSTFTKAGTTTFDGQPAYVIKGTGSGGQGGTLLIAATGKPFPLEIKPPGPKAGSLTFSNWDKSVTIKAPSHSIDYNSLTSGA
jgi:hypothetical protein